MTWSVSIADEIAGMFDDYSWRADEIEDALEKRRARYDAYHAAYRKQPGYRQKATKYMNSWRAKNRDAARKCSRAQSKSDRERAKVDPVFGAKYRAMRAASNRRWRAKNLERARARRRDERARQRAAAGLPPPRPYRRKEAA